MPKYLLDTDICISYLKGKFNINQKIIEIGLKNCLISEITIFELTYGAYNSSQFEKHIREVEKMKERFTVLPISGTVNMFSAEKTRLRKQGLLIPDFDLLIGCTAVASDSIMVTNNEKHIKRVKDIIIENWRKSEFNNFINPS